MPSFLPLNPCAVPLAFIKSIRAVRLDTQSVFSFYCLPLASELGEGLPWACDSEDPDLVSLGRLSLSSGAASPPGAADRSRSSPWRPEQRRAARGPGADLSGSRTAGARPCLSRGPRGSSWRAGGGVGRGGPGEAGGGIARGAGTRKGTL